MTKNKRFTASDLKYEYKKRNNGYFFDRISMKFFGDSMANFYVLAQKEEIKSFSNINYTCYVLTRIRPVKNGLNTNYYFEDKTFTRVYTQNEIDGKRKSKSF